jgi:serine/threonine-protein kinase RIM15
LIRSPNAAPTVDGESAARYIKSTNNKNTSTPIIAVSAYSGADMGEASTLFAASLSKPLQKADLLAVMRELGFKTSTANTSTANTSILGKAKPITAR